jgi:putative sigma-54 modulation protein
MKVNIQSLHFDADKKLVEFINERISKLVQYNDSILGADVILKLDKSSDAENKVAEVIMRLAGNELFSKRQCKTFEEAVDGCMEALTTQVKKQRDKVKGL